MVRTRSICMTSFLCENIPARFLNAWLFIDVSVYRIRVLFLGKPVAIMKYKMLNKEGCNCAKGQSAHNKKELKENP